jgi:hypothetical protein
MVSGGEGPIAGTSRGVLGGRTSSALRFLDTPVPCVLFPYNAGKDLLSYAFRVPRGEFLNGDGGVELHGNWPWPKRATILLIGVESGTFGRFNSFCISHEGFKRCVIGGAQFGPYVRFKTACVTINLFVKTDVGDIEDDFEKVGVVRWDIPELTPATKFISRKFDLVQGAETLGEGISESDPRGHRVTSGGGASLISDEPIVSISGEVGDGNGESLLIGQSVDVDGHVGDPRMWGRFSVEGRWLILFGYEGRGC